MESNPRQAVLLASLMLISLVVWSPTAIAADGDGDGFDDSIDDCPFASGNSTTTKLGCPDTDGDGTPDIIQGTVANFVGSDYARSVSTSSSRSSMSRTLAVAPNGMLLAGADSCDCVILFDASGVEIKTLLTIQSNPRDLDFAHNGTLLVVSAYEADNNASVHVFTVNWTTQTAALLVNLSANHDDDTYAARFSPDGSLLHVGGKDRNVTTYFTSNWTISNIISPDVGDVYNIKTSPDGRLVAFTHGEELSVHWTSNGTQLYNRHNHSGYTLALDWSPDGNWIVTGSSDNTIRIYHAGNGTLVRNLTYSGDVNEIAFNRAGTHFVIATSDNDPTWIIRTSDWSIEASFGSFSGGSGSGASGRRGARDVAWSLDETKIFFGARYYGRVYTYYSADAYIWLGGDVTGELMESRFREYSDSLPNHYNSTVTQVTQAQCSGTNPNGDAPLMGASSSTAAEGLTTRLSNYSVSGMRMCDQSGDILIEVPVARMPAAIMVKPNGLARQCIDRIGGLSMGQMRWILSGASASTLSTAGVHPSVVMSSIAPYDDQDGTPEWRDFDSSCPHEPIHIMHRWENRSVSQMISDYLFCNHCAFPEDWYAADFDRLRMVMENRDEIVSGVAGNDFVLGITELRVGLASSSVYHVPLFDNWTHGAEDAASAGETLIHPSVDNSTNGTWPFQDDYRLTLREEELSSVSGFAAWMLTEEGQDNFDEIGFVRLDPYSRALAGYRIGIDMSSILPDDDGDGIWNGDDDCAFTDPGLSVDAAGCAQNQLDDDDDGLINPLDDCPNTYGTSTQPTAGCPDADGDGWADTADIFPNDPTQWSDSDGDGFGDESNGFQPDACTTEYGLSTLDRFGCVDTDGDGWSDAADIFPTDASQWTDADEDGFGDNYTWTDVIDGLRQNENGDAFTNDPSQHKDRDGDGYGDNANGFLPDYCPDMHGTSNLGGRIGCPDTDGDGWADEIDAFPDEPSQHEDADGDGHGDSVSGVNADLCPGTLPAEILLVDILGCGPSERDGDYDGVSDADDQCPSTPPEEALQADLNGCAPSERDYDGDGVRDSDDLYPNDPSQVADSDADGYPDNASGTNGDACPLEAGTSTEDRRGCRDSDGDGWSDEGDILPFNSTQWADSDGDGYYDNYAEADWRMDILRKGGDWPGQYVAYARDPDRCPLDAYSYQNLENPGCPEDLYPAGESEDEYIPPSRARGDDGVSTWAIILILVALLMAAVIGGGAYVMLKKPSKGPKRSIVTSQDESMPETEPEEMLNPEDDPNYKVDEDGCEWWYDEGVWWYRKPEMDDWVEIETDDQADGDTNIV